METPYMYTYTSSFPEALFSRGQRVIDHAPRQLRYRLEIPEVATAP